MLLRGGSKTTSAGAPAARCHRHYRNCNLIIPRKHYAVSQLQHVSIETQQPGAVEQSPAAELLQWAASNGSVVHPALVIVDEAPCGCRGVVAAEDIDDASCLHMWSRHGVQPIVPPTDLDVGPPLLAIPERLIMSTTDALNLLSQALLQPAGSVMTKSQRTAQLHTSGASNDGSDKVWSNAIEGSGRFRNPFTNIGLRSFHRAMQQLLSALGIRSGTTADDLQQRLQQLQPPLLLALLLAHQRRLSHTSFWHCYIESLPSAPPCAWYHTVLQMLLCVGPTSNTPTALPSLQQHQRDLSTSRENQSPGLDDTLCPSSAAVNSRVLAAAAEAVAVKCRAAAELFGQALGGITAADVAWAYGQVVSRAFGVGGEGPPGLALLPVIDMLNHASGAAVPVCCVLPGQANFSEDEQWKMPGDQLSQSRGVDAADADAEEVEREGCGYWCVWHRQTSGSLEQAAHAQEALSSSSDVSRGNCDASPSASDGTVITQASEVQSGSGATADKVIMHKGQELYISYLSSCDADAAYLSFGFVPQNPGKS